MFDAGSVLGSLAGLPHFPMSFTKKIEHQLTTRQFYIYMHIIKSYDLIIYKKYYTTYTQIYTYIYIYIHTLALHWLFRTCDPPEMDGLTTGPRCNSVQVQKKCRGYCCLSLATDLNELAHVFFFPDDVKELVLKIAILAEKNAPNFGWYVDALSLEALAHG